MGERGRIEEGWVVAKAKTKKQDDTHSRVWSGYDVHMYPQGLDRCALTVGAISGPHYKIGALYWHL